MKSISYILIITIIFLCSNSCKEESEGGGDTREIDYFFEILNGEGVNVFDLDTYTFDQASTSFSPYKFLKLDSLKLLYLEDPHVNSELIIDFGNGDIDTLNIEINRNGDGDRDYYYGAAFAYNNSYFIQFDFDGEDKNILYELGFRNNAYGGPNNVNDPLIFTLIKN